MEEVPGSEESLLAHILKFRFIHRPDSRSALKGVCLGHGAMIVGGGER